MRNEKIFPRLSVVGSGKGCCIGTVPKSCCSFFVNFPAFEFVGGFGFDEVDVLNGFNDEIRVVSAGVVGPVDSELVWCGAQPFEDGCIVFEDVGELFFCFGVEFVLEMARFFKTGENQFGDEACRGDDVFVVAATVFECGEVPLFNFDERQDFWILIGGLTDF